MKKKIMEKKGWDDRGFSLVELIIVIAIMAILLGILTPQYVKYVRKSRVTTDMGNAQIIANAIGAAVADNETTLSLPAPGDIVSVTADDIPNMDEYPKSKVNPGYTWDVTLDSNNIVSIKLGTYQIWPDPDAADGYRRNLMP